MRIENKEMMDKAVNLSVYGQKRCFQAIQKMAFKCDKNHDKMIELMFSEMKNDAFCKQHNTDDASRLHLWIDEKIEKSEA